MRWWKLGLGAVLLLWVLGTAYLQARRRGRRIGPALLLVGVAAFAFAAASVAPQPPLTPFAASLLAVTSITCIARAMAFILWKGFGR